MLVIPAIDLRGGKCVRLIEGRLDQETIYSDDPAGMAQTFEQAGAERLHVVDLDGAFSGQMVNFDVIKKIVQGIKIPVQLGGGIRTMDSIDQLLDLGVSRVILGTAAISNLDLVQKSVEKYGGQIMVGIDSKNGQVAIEGWAETVGKTYLELGHEIRSLGITQVVFTDTRRDGTLQGPNLASSAELARTCDLEVIVSGGVSTIEDIRKIRQLKEPGIVGVIMGKALYAGKVDLKEAIKIGRGEEG
ncbi:1-(5-phosphoribosyl)-5-[(5-phosphoribosylamino)methylideneamino]imidazole-4-carboxamide isomerase [Dehalobacterium formicoaceticum]|uniref:1-(5-phosphoribosyl)-5-[(5-phosphoribosylamino)methylideneamino] imidazole-4-carboxamide isomerase n=1 Tax=Dehalobacterium formicoaceticum TaxID=51515 RepID=A0ABT1Y7M4_9FIRM|nr:1-(5-phosphoribosyl)-5-[(5-phosphoribosylamino)methylideneamino]imidazole-4-carboxamide isomerase [Dehalobacterium formicoaceticum]MCR6546887.1 1-(5-phosphoribosyl)-5-[(5-phosphoribosylamino)methylideneamino]imidazole-4-carboxamide isomerase [Dehalobacterium formicoaceticum]